MMQHIQGISRHYMRNSPAEKFISPKNQVQFIATLVKSVNLWKHSFTVQTFPKKRILNSLAISSKNFSITL